MLQFILLFCFIICSFDIAIDFLFVAAVFPLCCIICSFIVSIACFFVVAAGAGRGVGVSW